MEYTFGHFVIFSIGMGSVVTALAGRMGYLKPFYIIRRLPTIPQTTIYAILPVGILFVLGACFPNASETAVNIVFFSLTGCTVILLVWQPRWLKPNWLNWIEDNYGHVKESMFEEVRQMGEKKWANQMKTQADIEKWANSLAERKGWQRQLSQH